MAIGLALIVAGVLVISDETAYPGAWALLPVVGTVLVILGGSAGPTLPGRLLDNPPARYLGRISYSLYLWHWPILILVPIAVGNDDVTFRLALAGVSILVAAVSTELIERPFRRASFLAARSRGTVQLGLAASFAVGIAALFVSGAINIPTPWTQQDPVVVELAGVRDDLPASYADGCHINDYQAKKPVDCVYGDPQGTRTAVLFGDSHAAQWLPALDRYARDRGWRLEYHTKAACSPVLLPTGSARCGANTMNASSGATRSCGASPRRSRTSSSWAARATTRSRKARTSSRRARCTRSGSRGWQRAWPGCRAPPGGSCCWRRRRSSPTTRWTAWQTPRSAAATHFAASSWMPNTLRSRRQPLTPRAPAS